MSGALPGKSSRNLAFSTVYLPIPLFQPLVAGISKCCISDPDSEVWIYTATGMTYFLTHQSKAENLRDARDEGDPTSDPTRSRASANSKGGSAEVPWMRLNQDACDAPEILSGMILEMWFKWHRNDTPQNSTTQPPVFSTLTDSKTICLRNISNIWFFLIFILISIIWQSLKLPGRKLTSKIFPVRSTWSTCFFLRRISGWLDQCHSHHVRMAPEIPCRQEMNPKVLGEEAFHVEFCWVGTFLLEKKSLFIRKGTAHISIDPSTKIWSRIHFRICIISKLFISKCIINNNSDIHWWKLILITLENNWQQQKTDPTRWSSVLSVRDTIPTFSNAFQKTFILIESSWKDSLKRKLCCIKWHTNSGRFRAQNNAAPCPVTRWNGYSPQGRIPYCPWRCGKFFWGGFGVANSVGYFLKIRKTTMFNRRYIFKGSIFHCYVSLPECKHGMLGKS